MTAYCPQTNFIFIFETMKSYKHVGDLIYKITTATITKPNEMRRKKRDENILLVEFNHTRNSTIAYDIVSFWLTRYVIFCI